MNLWADRCWTLCVVHTLSKNLLVVSVFKKSLLVISSFTKVHPASMLSHLVVTTFFFLFHQLSHDHSGLYILRAKFPGVAHWESQPSIKQLQVTTYNNTIVLLHSLIKNPPPKKTNQLCDYFRTSFMYFKKLLIHKTSLQVLQRPLKPL